MDEFGKSWDFVDRELPTMVTHNPPFNYMRNANEVFIVINADNV